MKTKLKQNQTGKQKQNSKVMELSNLTELTEQEAEVVIGGSATIATVTKTLGEKISDSCDKCWGYGGSGGSGSGGGSGG